MAVKKSSTRKTRSPQAASLTRLRKLGLTKSQAGKTGKRLGGSAYATLRKFQSVLTGEAAVIAAPRDVVKKYKGTFAGTKTKLVVPKARGETVRLTRSGNVSKTKLVIPGEPKVRIVIPPRINTLQALPRGIGYRYRVNYGTSRFLFESHALLQEFLAHYGPDHKFNVGFIEVIPPSGRRRRSIADDDEFDDMDDDE